VNSSDEDFIKPSDEDAQGNVIMEEELTSIRMSDSHQTPIKEDKNRQHNHTTKIALRRLSQTEKDSINKNMSQIT
jgi:hypothetical protein